MKYRVHYYNGSGRWCTLKTLFSARSGSQALIKAFRHIETNLSPRTVLQMRIDLGRPDRRGESKALCVWPKEGEKVELAMFLHTRRANGKWGAVYGYRTIRPVSTFHCL